VKRNDPEVAEPVLAECRRLRKAIARTTASERHLRDEQAVLWARAMDRGVSSSAMAAESGVSSQQVRAEVGRARRELSNLLDV